jgi:pyruvate carboxylase
MTSQPSLAAIIAATDHTKRATGLSLDGLLDLEPYWETVRALYEPFETQMRAPTGRVYRHEIPGGQLSNLRQQALALGLGDRFEEIEVAYAHANALLGDIVKVTPTSKVVGDLALFAVAGRIDWGRLREHPERFDLPDSVLAYLRGELGEPAGGLPQPFAERALRTGCASHDQGAASDPPLDLVPNPPFELEPDLDLDLDVDIDKPGPDRRAALSELMFPAPYRDFLEATVRYGDVSVIPTRAFLYGLEPGREETIDLKPGLRLEVDLEAVGEADARGMRTVLTRLNGQTRPLDVRDESIDVSSAAVERADPSHQGHVGAPLTGVVTLQIQEGDEVAEGDPIAILEAMKMESTITAPAAGRVTRIATETGRRLEQGDLILVLDGRR